MSRLPVIQRTLIKSGSVHAANLKNMKYVYN